MLTDFCKGRGSDRGRHLPPAPRAAASRRAGALVLLAALSAPPAAAGLRFQPANAPEGADVNALAPDGATLWAATYRGVWRLSAGAWTLDGLGDRTVTSVAVAGGSVWAATGEAVYRRDASGSWGAETLPSTNAFPSILAADGDTLYAGGLGVFRRSGGTWSALASPGPGLVTAMTRDAGGLLVGLSTGLVTRLTGSSFVALGSFVGATEPVQAILSFGGVVYAGTSRALYAWSGGTWTADSFLGMHDVRAIAAAPLRVATLDAGVLQNPGSGWSALNGGLATKRAKSLALLGSDLFLGTGGGPVYRLSGSAWVKAGDGLDAAEVTDALTTTTGFAVATTFATRGAGISGGSLPDGCGDVYALASAPSQAGILAATGCGVFLNGEAASQGLPSTTLVTSLTDTMNGVAGGTSNAGVYRFSGSGWSADNAGLTSSTRVATLRQVGWNLFAYADDHLALRGSNGLWTDAGQGLPTGSPVSALGGNSDNAFAGLSTGGVHRRVGTTWRSDSWGFLSSPVHSLDLAGSRLFAAAGAGGLLVKSEGGYRPEKAGLPAGADVRLVRASLTEPARNAVVVGTAGHGAFLARAEGTVRTLPVVLDVVGGTGTRFRTELTLGNRSTRTAAVRVTFTPAAGFGATSLAPVSATVALEPARELRVPDALDWLRSLGLPLPPAGTALAGSLTFVNTSTTSTDEVDTLTAIARTYTTGSGGTFGLFYDAPTDLDAAEESAAVYGLRTVSGQARSNLALVHVPGRGEEAITLSVQAYDAAGAAAGAPMVRTLAPGEWSQINSVLDAAGLPDGSFGYARITRTAGSGAWIAYGVVNDAVTSDGSFLSMQRPGGAGAARRQIVPIVLDVLGAAGSHYTTELTLVNDGPIATPVDLTYQPAPGFGGVTGSPLITVNVPARAQVTLPDVLQAFRDRGIGVPAASAGGSAGTLHVEFRYLTNLDVGTTLALARTTTPGAGGAGSYGLFYPAVAVGGGGRGSAVVPSLRQDASARSNLAVVHTGGGSQKAITLAVKLYDADAGTAVGTALTVTLQPGEWRQWSSVMSQAGVAAAVTRTWATVTRTAGDDTFFAYGVQNDAATSDGSYLPMIPAERY